jgi:8-oxo-dGTP pyrophosphatase MutT (NUDIX family)
VAGLAGVHRQLTQQFRPGQVLPWCERIGWRVACCAVADPTRTKWLVRGERLVDENPHIRLSVATVELPDGTVFDQYVMRMRRAAMTVVLDEQRRHVLLVWRHRFIIDRWVWELPGGYVDPSEDARAAALREVEEETGWRPRSAEHVLTFQPVVGSADCPQDLYIAYGAERVGEPDVNESEAVRWVPLDEIPPMIARGEIVGSGTIIGVQHALAPGRGSAG